MEKTYARLKDRAEFYAVYIKEAHPTDGWRSSGNDRVGIKIAQAKSFQERVDAAARCCGALHMTIPLVVDSIDDRVGEAYSGFPDRLYIVDRNGKVAYKGGRGPFGFIPSEMEQSLQLLLLEEQLRADANGANVELGDPRAAQSEHRGDGSPDEQQDEQDE